MSTPRTRELVYLALAVAGAVIPLAAILPWLVAHGLDIRLLVAELFANRVSAFFALDVIISAIVVLVMVATPGELTRGQRLAVVAGTLFVGVSLGLPLLLVFRERARSARPPSPP